VGTAPGEDDDYGDAMLGTGDRGVSAQVRRACEHLRRWGRICGADARITVDAFGFSRGAAAARYFVNCIHRGFFHGVASANFANEPTPLPSVQLPRATVRFLGLFDTVAAIGEDREGPDGITDARNGDVNVHLRPGSAAAVVHLTAADEHRFGFALNSILPVPGPTPVTWGEFACPGAHSDVGGGYGGVGETLHPVAPTAAPDEFQNFRNRMVLEEYAAGNAEFSVVGDHGTWIRPDVRNGLQCVAMRIMHDNAMTHSVPLRRLPNRSEYAIPDDLRPVYDALMSTGVLDAAMRRLVRRKYVHWSAHYGRETGRHPEGVARAEGNWPAEDERRQIHPNQPGQASPPRG
jgi:hypothetical protein